VRAGVPIVGLEPSCVATFRDELPGLIPDDPDAVALSRNVFTLAELLQQRAPDWQPPRLQGKAVVHAHCHHKAVMGMRADRDLLAKTGLDVTFLDAGCCGLAGSFGFEAEHYDISIACGEQALLPSVRAISAETPVLADGFSCRNQILHGSARRGLHLAQALSGASASPLR